MTRRNSKKRGKNDLSLDQINQEIQKLNVQKMAEIEKGLRSDDPAALLKAQSYLNGLNKSNQSQQKAYFFDPFAPSTDGTGYRRKNHSINFKVLRTVSKIPIIKTVHNTRFSQVENFLRFQIDDQKEGYTIRRKLSRFADRPKEVPKEDHKTIEYIVEFLENSRKPTDKKVGGINFDVAKWDEFDDFGDFVRMILNDTYTFDQVAVENTRSRRFELLSYRAVDASTVRYLDTVNKRMTERNQMFKYDEVNGYLPRYGQVWDGQIINDEITGQPIVWYPWELSFAIRNKSTDIHSNMYGLSELEVLVDVITYFLYGFQYNGNFFKNGSNPKGFINFKSAVDTETMNAFKQMWRALASGSGNEHKIPMFEGTDVEFVSMQENNRDMEFHKWLEFLIVMICSVYCIDPSELGFNFEGASKMFGQDGQKERLDHSKNKGLKPILMFLQKFISRYIVEEINPDFEFVFTGVDIEDESTRLENDIKKVNSGAISLESLYEKYSGTKLTDADTILNPIAFQYKQAKQYGGQQENQMVNRESGGEDVGAQDPMKSFESESKDNPIVKSCLEYIHQNFDYES